jgi:hypothetical protein
VNSLCSLLLCHVSMLPKTDIMSQLEKENDFKVEHFDFIQYSLRKFCLERKFEHVSNIFLFSLINCRIHKYLGSFCKNVERSHA